MEQIIELLHRNENITGRFIYRLCGGETTTVNITKELLKQIFEAALHCLKSESEILNETEVYRIAKELLKPYPNGSDLIIENVKFEDVKLMCQKMNANYLGIDEMLNMFLHFTNENVEKVANAITLNKLTLDECKAQIENGFNQCKIDKEIFYIEIVNKILFIKQNFALRPTQKIAILFALKNYQSSTDQSGILQQIATGEGKTLIIAVVSIISVLKGYTVNIVTSSPVLAKRDAKDPPCVELFKVFGLKI
uniref:Chloroplast protein-transporting ATPase n=1 Tax=Panagrolaimus superbus TaxID=310955 RepID=A0A914Z9U6_9BILA